MLARSGTPTSPSLSGADAFHAELDGNVLASVHYLDRRPDAAVLAASFEAVVGRFPHLACRLVSHPKLRLERVTVFRPADAITFLSVADSGQFLAEASLIYTMAFPSHLPPWRIVVLSSEMPVPTWLAVLCFHHCILDGIGMRDMLKALSIAADPSKHRPEPAHSSSVRTRRFRLRTAARAASSLVRELKNVGAGALGVVQGTSSRDRVFSVLDLPRTPLRLVCHALGVGVVPVLLVLVGEALARCVEAPVAQPLRIMVPQAVEHRGVHRNVGNQYAPIVVEVPLAGSTAAERIRLVDRDRQTALAGVPFEVSALQMKLLAQLPRMLRRFCYLRWAAGVDLICSIVPSDVEGIRFGGAQVMRHYGFAPLPEGHGLSVLIVCAPKQLRVGLLIDPAIIASPAWLMDALPAAYADLVSSVRP
jgi:hypothetical protein